MAVVKSVHRQHFFEIVLLLSPAHRPGSQPPPPASGQPVLMNGNGYMYNNVYQPQAGYYGVPGQAFYPPPQPGAYPGYPPQGNVSVNN